MEPSAGVGAVWILDGDEVFLAHQRRAAGFGGHDPGLAVGSPLHGGVAVHPVGGFKSDVFAGLTIPYLPPGVERVRQDRRDGRQHPT
jgi:hypothetical protein